MTKPTCSIDGCHKLVHCGAVCSMHWARVVRHGDPHWVWGGSGPTTERGCVADGCERKFYAKGMCRLHYRRWATNDGDIGDPERVTDAERFWSKVDVRGPMECWPWVASLDTHGRPQMRRPGGGTVRAYRFAWGLTAGHDLPESLSIDHLCRNPACVNPAHLDPVSPALNRHRQKLHPAVHAALVPPPQRRHLNAAP